MSVTSSSRHSAKEKHNSNFTVAVVVDLLLRHWDLLGQTVFALPHSNYNRTLMARTLIARLPCLTRTRSCVPMAPYKSIMWLHFYIHVFMLLFSFSICSDQRTLNIENKNNSMKHLAAEVSYLGLGSLEFIQYSSVYTET